MKTGHIELSEWKQGDFFLEETSIPILETFEQFTEIDISGFAVVSQTCDIVRDYEDRPFVQLAALVPVEEEAQLDLIRKFHQPQFGYIPKLAEHGLVVNFDLVITIDKKALSQVNRMEGCPDAKNQSDFSFAAGRNRSRFAFPDSVSIGLRKLRSWVSKKGRKNGDEGQFLSSVSEIRLSVDDFENPVDATFLCILKPEVDNALRSAWSQKMAPKILELVREWCDSSTCLISKPSEIVLEDYLYSQLLDFDALTKQKK